VNSEGPSSCVGNSLVCDIPEFPVCIYVESERDVRNRLVVFPGGQRPQHIVTCIGENIQKTP
jgi:hypothetical protein